MEDDLEMSRMSLLAAILGGESMDDGLVIIPPRCRFPQDCACRMDFLRRQGEGGESRSALLLETACQRGPQSVFLMSAPTKSVGISMINGISMLISGCDMFFLTQNTFL